MMTIIDLFNSLIKEFIVSRVCDKKGSKSECRVQRPQYLTRPPNSAILINYFSKNSALWQNTIRQSGFGARTHCIKMITLIVTCKKLWQVMLTNTN